MTEMSKLKAMRWGWLALGVLFSAGALMHLVYMDQMAEAERWGLVLYSLCWFIAMVASAAHAITKSKRANEKIKEASEL